MLLVGPLMSGWSSVVGPMRMIPWTAVSGTQYNNITRDGISYNTEKATGVLNAFIVGNRGGLLRRDPRCLHGGTPNRSLEPRPTVATFAYSQEAVSTHLGSYVKNSTRMMQRSLPRFGDVDASWNEEKFNRTTDMYGEMRTL